MRANAKMRVTTLVGLTFAIEWPHCKKLYSVTDLDLFFLRSKIENVNISETVRTSRKKSWDDFCIFLYFPLHNVIAKIVLRDLDLLFEVKTFISLKLAWTLRTVRLKTKSPY